MKELKIVNCLIKPSGYKFNFHTYHRGTTDSLGTEYDYRSVMHYGSRAFSKNGKPTIVAKQSGVGFNSFTPVNSHDH